VLKLETIQSTFRDKAPGFQEIKNTTKTNQYVIEMSPLQFSYLLRNRFLLQAGFGKISYSNGKTETTLPTSGDAAGNGSNFVFAFTPSLSRIGISIIL
jgi:hypothetical protein